MDDLEDAILVEQYLQGDQSAFERVYKKYSSRIAGYCYRFLLDETTTQDVVQTVFTKALEALASLRKPASLYHWLFTVARNEVYGHFRSARSHPTVELTEDVWESETPHESAVRREAIEIVRDCLDRLKLEYREVLLLRQFEGFSYREIAEITNSSVSAVESRLFKARKALIRQLELYYVEQERLS